MPEPALIPNESGFRREEVPGVPANVEIKARLLAPDRARRLLEELTGEAPRVLSQEDTFFPVPRGRLKLRLTGNGPGELIAYHRDMTTRPSVSEYLVVPANEPALLRDALAGTLGVRGTVRKTRLLFLLDQTRVHLDTVEGLGDFLELEVVLRPGQTIAEGDQVARGIMARLGIEDPDLLAEAYIDMLERARARP